MLDIAVDRMPRQHQCLHLGGDDRYHITGLTRSSDGVILGDVLTRSRFDAADVALECNVIKRLPQE